MWSRVMSLCGPDYEHSCDSVPFPALDHLAVGSGCWHGVQNTETSLQVLGEGWVNYG